MFLLPLLLKPVNFAPQNLNLGMEDKTQSMGVGTGRSLETRMFHSLFTEVEYSKVFIFLFLMGIY